MDGANRTADGQEDAASQSPDTVGELLSQDVKNGSPYEMVQELQQRWNLLVKHLPDLLLIVARDGTVLAINRTVTRETVQEVLGKNAREYVPAEHHDYLMSHLEQVFLTGKPVTYELLGDGPEGPGTAWYRTRAVPLERDGQVYAAMQIVSDVTARKKAEEDRAALQEHLRAKLETERDALAARIAELGLGAEGGSGLGGMIGRSDGMRALYEALLAAARADVSVLVHGETGTGKELAAKAVHGNSRRRDGPLVKVDCGALAGTLLESELFGHVRGAFTGATRDRVGRFEAADGGTVFLDEIHNLPVPLQSKLLRVVQDGTFERVGSSDARRVDVRIIAATNQNLESLVEDGLFRKDLYYRLNVVALRVPPLRERKGDILLLADHYVRHFARTHGRAVEGIARPALEKLTRYSWPGNVRELVNVLERAVVLCAAPTIQESDMVLPDQAGRASPLPKYGSWSEYAMSLEKHVLQEALEKAGWNRSRAARDLGMGRSTLYEKLKRHGLLVPQGRNASAPRAAGSRGGVTQGDGPVGTIAWPGRRGPVP